MPPAAVYKSRESWGTAPNPRSRATALNNPVSFESPRCLLPTYLQIRDKVTFLTYTCNYRNLTLLTRFLLTSVNSASTLIHKLTVDEWMPQNDYTKIYSGGWGRGGETIRGKLRDKRSDSRQERTSREQVGRRRPPKRESRISILRIQHLEEDYLFDEGNRTSARDVPTLPKAEWKLTK